MFSYATSSKFQFDLKIDKLSKHKEWAHQVAVWAEEKWGYIRRLGLVEREKIINQMIEDFYIVIYAGQPIGMFALSDYEWKMDSKKVKELKYFYIDEKFRNIGVGGRILEAAKRIAAKQGAEVVVLDTLNPQLNKFYEKHGAKAVSEGQLFGCPTSILSIALPKKESFFSYKNLIGATMTIGMVGLFAYHVTRGKGASENVKLTNSTKFKI